MQLKSKINLKSRELIGLGLFFWIMIVGAVWAFHSQGKSSQIKVDALSDRAKEFVQTEKKKASSSWKWSDVTATESSRVNNTSKTITSDCILVHFPVLTRNEHVTNFDKHCVVEARVDSPPARLVIGIQPSIGSLDEDPNIIMRKKFPKDYSLEKMEFSNWQESQVYREKEGVVVFLQKEDRVVTVALTEMINPTQADEELLKQIVAGIVILD